MSSKGRTIDFETARKAAAGLDYIYSLEISAIRLLPILPDLTVNWDECLDVRCFSNDKEIHFFKQKDDWKAVLIEDAPDDAAVTRTYRLPEKYKKACGGNRIIVKEYLAYDEDGQAVPVCTRLAGIGSVK